MSELFRNVDMLTLDLRGVTDIDFSAATILQYECVRSRRADKRLLLCNVLPQLVELLTTAGTASAVPSSAIMPDLDTALEWMEEETLRKLVRSGQDRLPLERNGLFRGLAEDEMRVIVALLRHQTFEPGAVLSHEGDDMAEEMWILTKGTVSIRLNFAEGKRSRQVAKPRRWHGGRRDGVHRERASLGDDCRRRGCRMLRAKSTRLFAHRPRASADRQQDAREFAP